MLDDHPDRIGSDVLTRFLTIGTIWGGLLISGFMLAAAMILSS